MLIVSSIRLPLTADKNDAIAKALKQLKVKQTDVKQANISKISVDARRQNISLVYSVAVSLKNENAEEALAASASFVSYKKQAPYVIQQGATPLSKRPIVCGFGPAGIFCALVLAKHGFAPLVLERGAEMQQRKKDVDAFLNTGVLNVNSNIQFGEGGAGTFSDGKLTTRIQDEKQNYVTNLLLEHNAPEEIAFQHRPHIGTDKLSATIVSIREEIIRLGGQVLFETQLTRILEKNGMITGVETTKGTFETNTLVLAVGHSARDVFSFLMNDGYTLEAKPFSVGYRIEHLQTEIDKALFHEAAGHPAIGKGEYQLSTNVNGRGVYTFCMCPGGNVVAATSEENSVVTNGMSYHARGGKNANAAVVASVLPQEFDNDPQKAILFQKQLEQSAFQVGKAYQAPAETVGSFLQNKGQLVVNRVEPTYPLQVAETRLQNLLPQNMASSIAQALPIFDKKIKGFAAHDSVLTGLETRTSSPVRILRNAHFQTNFVKGVYPCGEGAGYAGGIMSAAVDGVRVAEAIINEYRPLY